MITKHTQQHYLEKCSALVTYFGNICNNFNTIIMEKIGIIRMIISYQTTIYRCEGTLNKQNAKQTKKKPSHSQVFSKKKVR